MPQELRSRALFPRYPRGPTRSGFEKTALQYRIRFELIQKSGELVSRGLGADSQTTMVTIMILGDCVVLLLYS